MENEFLLCALAAAAGSPAKEGFFHSKWRNSHEKHAVRHEFLRRDHRHCDCGCRGVLRIPRFHSAAAKRRTARALSPRACRHAGAIAPMSRLHRPVRPLVRASRQAASGRRTDIRSPLTGETFVIKTGCALSEQCEGSWIAGLRGQTGATPGKALAISRRRSETKICSAENSYQTDYDQIQSDDIVQQFWHDKYENSSKQRYQWR